MHAASLFVEPLNTFIKVKQYTWFVIPLRASVIGLSPVDLDAGSDLSELVNFQEDDLVGMAPRGHHDDGSSKETLAEMIATVVVSFFTLLYITLVIFTTRSCT